jgi:glycosyltransferase involved in cell wall biosynthesis
MSRVTIVMATYNGEKYLAGQLDSILASSHSDYVIHVYDDGSKDGTMEILKEYEAGYPDKIKVFRNKGNLGITVNFLNAVCRTDSDYVMLSDQDDVWKHKKISDTLERMRYIEARLGKDKPAAVFTDAEVADDNLNIISKSFFRFGRLNPQKTDLAHLLMENKLIGCTMMVNAALRDILKKHNMPKHAKYHDWWLALMAASFGSIGYCGEATMYYRQHGDNAVGSRSFISYVKNRIFSPGVQKASIRILVRQAAEFMAIYKDIIPGDKLRILIRFSRLYEYNFIRRRYVLLRYGYLKTGLIRNIGLLLIA